MTIWEWVAVSWVLLGCALFWYGERLCIKAEMDTRFDAPMRRRMRESRRRWGQVLVGFIVFAPFILVCGIWAELTEGDG